jgi:hypothetical protein
MSDKLSTEEIALMRIGLTRPNLGEAEEAARIQGGIAETMRGILQDGRATEPRSMAAPPRSSEEPWRTKAAEVPREPPPGINLIDAMCDAADHRDKMAAIRQAIENKAVEVLLREKKP